MYIYIYIYIYIRQGYQSILSILRLDAAGAYGLGRGGAPEGGWDLSLSIYIYIYISCIMM